MNNNDTQHTSTNEKIIIDYDDLEDGEYTIHVYGGHFTDSLFYRDSPTQDFAVVASGPIAKGYLKFTKSSECPCEKCDQEHPGFCQCDSENESGPVCKTEIETIHGNSGSFTVDTLGVKRVKFILNDIIHAIVSKSTNPGRSSTIWASPKCHLSLGEYETNGNTNDHSSSSDDKKTIQNFNTKEICVAIFNNNDREATYDIELLKKPPEPTETPTPSLKPEKKGGSGSSNNSNDKEEKRDIPQILGDFQIQTAYIGSSSIIDFQAGYNLMKIARNLMGRIIPPPNLVHTAIWVGEENPTDESLGAIFVYGKYRSNKNDPTYLNFDGARSYVMSFGEFKYYYDTYEIQKIIPKRKIKLFDFIREVKSSGHWRADTYNWPTNNCQHFTLKLINIIKAVRDSPNENDWTNLPPLILKTLQSNEKEAMTNIH